MQPGAPGIVDVGTVPVSVSLPDVTGTYNEILAIPVSLGNATGLGMVAAEVFVCYDGDVLLPTGTPVNSTSATTNWTIEHNIAQGSGTPIDTLKIAMADEVALSGAGDVLRLNFTVADLRTPSSSTLSFEHVLFNDGTPANAPTNGSFTLTGNDGSIASAPATIIPRQTIDVTVDEPDEDRTASADQLTVQIANGAQTETLILDESGAQTGLFTGSINTVFALTAVSDDNTIQAQAGDVIVFSYDDLLDGNGNTVPRTDQTNVIGGTDGSLRVTVVSQPGDTVRVRLTDGDLNTDPNQQETTTVTAVNNITNESETITLTELDIDDEIFFGIVETTPGAVAGTDNDGTFNTQEGDELVATYDDTLLANGGTGQLTDTDFVVDPFGDADDNGQVQAFDAAKVLLHVLSPFLTGLDSLSANLDLLAFDAVNGKITPFDASLILQKRVGLLSRFPVQEDEADNHPQPETDNSVPKRILDQRLLTLQPMHDYLAVVADERSGILSGDVLVRGSVERMQMGTEMHHFLSASRAGEEGLRLVFAGAREVSGPGELLRIYAGVGPERVQLIRASFNDGRIVARLEGVAASIAVPQAYALYANYPNPFNPETAIRFDLPQAETVRLEVFDLLGQHVRTLVDGWRAAGLHEVLWNGRNEMGAKVGSGLYFYRLRAGNFVQTRRMLLLK